TQLEGVSAGRVREAYLDVERSLGAVLSVDAPSPASPPAPRGVDAVSSCLSGLSHALRDSASGRGSDTDSTLPNPLKGIVSLCRREAELVSRRESILAQQRREKRDSDIRGARDLCALCALSDAGQGGDSDSGAPMPESFHIRAHTLAEETLDTLASLYGGCSGSVGSGGMDPDPSAAVESLRQYLSDPDFGSVLSVSDIPHKTRVGGGMVHGVVVPAVAQFVQSLCCYPTEAGGGCTVSKSDTTHTASTPTLVSLSDRASALLSVLSEAAQSSPYPTLASVSQGVSARVTEGVLSHSVRCISQALCSTGTEGSVSSGLATLTHVCKALSPDTPVCIDALVTGVRGCLLSAMSSALCIQTGKGGRERGGSLWQVGSETECVWPGVGGGEVRLVAHPPSVSAGVSAVMSTAHCVGQCLPDKALVSLVMRYTRAALSGSRTPANTSASPSSSKASPYLLPALEASLVVTMLHACHRVPSMAMTSTSTDASEGWLGGCLAQCVEGAQTVCRAALKGRERQRERERERERVSTWQGVADNLRSCGMEVAKAVSVLLSILPTAPGSLSLTPSAPACGVGEGVVARIVEGVCLSVVQMLSAGDVPSSGTVQIGQALRDSAITVCQALGIGKTQSVEHRDGVVDVTLDIASIRPSCAVSPASSPSLSLCTSLSTFCHVARLLTLDIQDIVTGWNTGVWPDTEGVPQALSVPLPLCMDRQGVASVLVRVYEDTPSFRDVLKRMQ
ncbi:hypothetical protein KIPB_009006, partial [Kipferlia bialata]